MNDRRRFTILMNPASAGGKAQRLLPEVRAMLGAAGAETKVVQTQDLPHAADAARAATEGGETVVASPASLLPAPPSAFLVISGCVRLLPSR